MKDFKTPLEALRYHVTGKIERGEGQAIEAVIASHTPGPWAVGYCRDLNESKITYTISKPNGDGDSTRIFSSIEETKANKALIAAAPELLNALEIVVQKLGPLNLDGEIFKDELKELIKKAKGQ